jgi:phospholipid/cholesterol/gamma-HCH transport system ATP-binding protein
VAVLADKKVIAIGTIPELLALDHPWIQEYFNGPRGRAAHTSEQRGRSAEASRQRIEDNHAPLAEVASKGLDATDARGA